MLVIGESSFDSLRMTLSKSRRVRVASPKGLSLRVNPEIANPDGLRPSSVEVLAIGVSKG